MTDVYAVFGWAEYYPEGGYNDHIATVAEPAEAARLAQKYIDDAGDGYAHAQVVDLRTGTIIDRFASKAAQ